MRRQQPEVQHPDRSAMMRSVVAFGRGAEKRFPRRSSRAHRKTGNFFFQGAKDDRKGLTIVKDEHSGQGLPVSLLTYRVGDQVQALPTSSVAYVLRNPSILSGNEEATEVLFQGKRIPVADLRRLLNVSGSRECRHLLLVRSEDGLVGFRVEAAEAVIHCDVNRVAPVPSVLAGLKHLKGILKEGGAPVILTDLTLLAREVIRSRAPQRAE